MMIYEVNLNINKEIYPEFIEWLREHIKEILQLPGFIQACLLEEELEQTEGFDQEKLTVQYQLESKDDLQRYFTDFAPKMREDGINRFKDQFSANRRIFSIQEVTLK